MKEASLILSTLLLAFLLCNFTNKARDGWYAKTNYNCKSEKDTLTKSTIFITADKEATNEGGQIALMRKFAKITMDSIPDDLDTRFMVAFIIKEDGQIVGERILRDKTGGTVGQQMIKIVKSFKWTAGECDGKKVPMLLKLPLQICLREE